MHLQGLIMTVGLVIRFTNYRGSRTVPSAIHYLGSKKFISFPIWQITDYSSLSHSLPNYLRWQALFFSVENFNSTSVNMVKYSTLNNNRPMTVKKDVELFMFTFTDGEDMDSSWIFDRALGGVEWWRSRLSNWQPPFQFSHHMGSHLWLSDETK